MKVKQVQQVLPALQLLVQLQHLQLSIPQKSSPTQSNEGILVESTVTTIATIAETTIARKSSDAVPSAKRGSSKEVHHESSMAEAS
jgi:hypothetical protein